MLAASNLRHRSSVSSSVGALLDLNAALLLLLLPGESDSDDDNDYFGGDHDDIYIMMKCVSVCHKKLESPVTTCNHP